MAHCKPAVPAKAGTQQSLTTSTEVRWIPAFAGMSGVGAGALLQLVLHLLEAGIDAVIVDTGRARHTDAADHLIADPPGMAMTFGKVTC